MTLDPPVTEDDIEAFISGHLDEMRRRIVAEHLRNDPLRQADVHLLIEHQEALRQIGREILEEPLPERLLRLLDDTVATAPGHRNLLSE